MEQAFSEMEGKLKDFLEEAKDPEADMGLLLSFTPLVEEILKEDQGYCLVAEEARIQAKKDESFNNWLMMGVGALAAIPCFISGPIGASVCLAGGMGIGIWGYEESRVAREESLGRALTGSQFETISGLSDRERELFLAKLFLPLGAWGTTAVPARAASKMISKTVAKTVKRDGVRIGNKDSMGVFSVKSLADRKQLGERSLGRSLSQKEAETLERAHRVGLEQRGKDGTPARIGNYTEAQLREKNRILKQAGFSKVERRKLIEDGIVGQNSSTGIENYQETLVRLAKSSLGIDNLSSQQMKALENYHSVVRGQMGKDGTPASVGNYTVGQIRKIVRFLEKEFSPEQVRTLIEEGVVEVNRIDAVVHNKKVLKSLTEGKVDFVFQDYSNPLKINRLLEATDNGVLIEVERVASGQFKKSKVFISNKTRYRPAKDNDLYPAEALDPRTMIRILERTDSGFVVDMGKDGNAFFSFEKAIERGLLPKNPTARDYRELEEVLNNYMSGKFDQIPALKDIVQKKGDTFTVIDRKMYSKFRGKLRNSLIGAEVFFESANPEVEAIFLAAKSTRKRIDSDDLILPPSTNKKIQLEKQGFAPDYTAGIDQMNEWVAVRRQLQELKANPYKTHIKYFEDQVPDHIAHIRKGLKDNYSPSSISSGSKLEDQLRRLEILEEEAKKAILDEKVTYKWWLEFNERLSQLMSGEGAVLSKAGVFRIRNQIKQFPLKIIIPTTEAELGIMTFNKAGIEGIYPAGLINKPAAEADGIGYSANGFFLHDFEHAEFVGNQHFLMHSVSHRLFHKRLLRNIENLPPDKRKRAEAVYFTTTHEMMDINLSSLRDDLQKQVTPQR